MSPIPNDPQEQTGNKGLDSSIDGLNESMMDGDSC
jgi:hypothetical protein